MEVRAHSYTARKIGSILNGISFKKIYPIQ
jgi:hypothetical protein